MNDPDTKCEKTTNEVELRALVTPAGDNYDVEGSNLPSIKPPIRGPKKQEGSCFLQRLMQKIDEEVSLKLLMRCWGPRLEFFVRLMLVATFIDDSFRSATHFTEQIRQVSQQGCLRWLFSNSPGLAGFIATVLLGIGLISQSIGSFFLLILHRTELATKALLGWTIAQPLLFAQLSNGMFVTESLSLVGGLLMMLHMRGGGSDRIQLLGRVLIPSAYVYDAGKFLFSIVTLDETNNAAMFLASLSMVFVRIAMFVGLLVVSALVAVGLKSRFIALVLAFINLGLVFYQHSFFLYFSREDGKWGVKDTVSLPQVALPEDVKYSDFDGWQILDFHRYYFFLGLSTSGALLLLAQFGPGEIAIQKDEVILPYVSRAMD